MRELSLPLTINAVIHRENIENLPAIIDYAVEVGAGRARRLAHTQYYAWAFANRAARDPGAREQFLRSVAKSPTRRRSGSKASSYSTSSPTITMPPAPSFALGGWGRNLLDITPSGKVLPCHA